jgi:acyl-coenzyme A synthetase/AMP-(fatty) acid ligase
MTADHVAFHAANRPDAVAIVNNGHEITYGDFSRDIQKFRRALREFELPPGAKIAIDCGDFYFNWLLRLASEELSLVTMTFSTLENPSSLSLLREFDLVLSESARGAEGGGRYHPITPEWLKGILDGPDPGGEPSPAKSPDDPLQILHTSGTTGTAKGLLLTRRMNERRVAKLMWFAGFGSRSRYLLAVTSTGRTHAACLWAGATAVIENRMTIPQAIASHAITHVTLPPIALKRVLDELPKDFVKPSDLTILSFGAAASRALRERALATMATEVCDLYGSNEAGFVSSRRGTAELGTVWPGAQIEIVDDRDGPVPHGCAGWIRVRTDTMVQGYIDDREASVRMFREGWFYARDLGILHDARRLQVVGRGDDLLNIGWRKLLPEPLEDFILKSVAIGDVGVCSITNPDGIEEICVVLSEPRCSDQEILERLTLGFRNYQIGGFHVVKTDRIPRNANGKIQRNLLRDLAAPAGQISRVGN